MADAGVRAVGVTSGRWECRGTPVGVTKARCECQGGGGDRWQVGVSGPWGRQVTDGSVRAVG